MAKRPVYVPVVVNGLPSVDKVEVEFQWHSGLSATQKKKSISSLHSEAGRRGMFPVLEISSKSESEFGRKLSAFNLLVWSESIGRKVSVEVAFQSSKRFEFGGPYKDILLGSSLDAKRDERLKKSGQLISFEYDEREFARYPKTFFYDWIYVCALRQNVSLADKLLEFRGFTDIEFNPEKSVNCQAYSAAIYVALCQSKKIDVAASSPEEFLSILSLEYGSSNKSVHAQDSLF